MCHTQHLQHTYTNVCTLSWELLRKSYLRSSRKQQVFFTPLNRNRLLDVLDVSETVCSCSVSQIFSCLRLSLCERWWEGPPLVMQSLKSNTIRQILQPRPTLSGQLTVMTYGSSGCFPCLISMMSSQAKSISPNPHTERVRISLRCPITSYSHNPTII